MVIKFFSRLTFLLFLFFILTSVSALGTSVAICGNGILETGEQCDAGRSAYRFEWNYPEVFCSSLTCNCPSGTSPLIKYFASTDRSQCLQITDCTEPISCLWDNPKCDCPGEPDCCPGNRKDWVDQYFECNTCNIPSGVSFPYGDGSCYCDDSSYFGLGYISGSSRPFCSSLTDPANYNCDWDPNLQYECVPSNITSTCTSGTTSCAYSFLGNITTACCAPGLSCDPLGTGCINSTSAPSAPHSTVSTSISVGAGNSEKRNIICKATVIPDEEGDYTFTFSLNGLTSPSIPKHVDPVPPCDRVFTPNPINVESTFTDALTPGSPEYTCRVDYVFPSESNYSVSSKINDLDKDSFFSKNQFPSWQPWSPHDVDDWVFNDTKYGDSTTSYLCLSSGSADYNEIINETLDKRKNCTVDNNNDGIGDFAACSYCRNPRAAEVADDIDNNGFGVCQANVSRACRVEGYTGDGADDASNTPVTNSSGAIVSRMGCGPVRNEFGVTDTFCQMTDNVPGMKEYQRAVKWGQRLFTSTVFSVSQPSLLGGPVEYNQSIYYEFIPGGSVVEDSFGNFKINEATCSLTEVVAPVEGSTVASIPGIGAFVPLINNDPSYASGYSLEKRSTGNWFGLQYVSALVKHTYYPGCMPSSESNGTHKGTTGAVFPSQFIDSFRGELDFTKFTTSPSVRSEKDSDGNFKWQWQTAFVNKDKCDDGVNNHGTTDILSVEPYGFFMDPIKQVIKEDGSVTDLNPQFNLFLIDVDNPECKFNNPVAVSGTNIVPKIYSVFDYKWNPMKGKSYCKDDDGDGFCGAVMISSLSSSGTSPGSSVPTYSMSYSPNLTDNKYTLSKQFPDCDDGTYNGMYLSGSQPLLVTKSLGWSDVFVGQTFTSWNVHPFAPVTKSACVLGSAGTLESNGYDFNCNKNGLEGQDISSLKLGKTPFDWSLGTGTENLAYGADSMWYEQVLLNTNRDAACYEYPAYRDFAIQTANAIAQTAVLGGVGVAFAPAIGGFLSTHKVFAMSLNVVGEAMTGYELYACLKDTTIPKWACYTSAGGNIAASVAPVVIAIRTDSLAIRSSKGATSALSGRNKKVSATPRSEVGSTDSPGLTKEVDTPVPGCFLNNTSVYLADGSLKNIADIELNDSILAWDLENNARVNASVTYTFVRNETKYRVVQYEEI